MLLEQILKLDCEACKLRTEHYVEFSGYIMVVCKCLRCGRLKNHLLSRRKESYPDDETKPVYVF